MINIRIFTLASFPASVGSYYEVLRQTRTEPVPNVLSVLVRWRNYQTVIISLHLWELIHCKWTSAYNSARCHIISPLSSTLYLFCFASLRYFPFLVQYFLFEPGIIGEWIKQIYVQTRDETIVRDSSVISLTDIYSYCSCNFNQMYFIHTYIILDLYMHNFTVIFLIYVYNLIHFNEHILVHSVGH